MRKSPPHWKKICVIVGLLNFPYVLRKQYRLSLFPTSVLDRLIKEKLQIRYYSRYMDDCVLVHEDKKYLKQCLQTMRDFAETELDLSFNEKTEIYPIKNGVDYLGWHFYMTDTGKIIRKVKQSTKYKYKRKLRYFQKAYSRDEIQLEEIKQVLSSYRSHFSFGHTYRLQEKILGEFVLKKGN